MKSQLVHKYEVIISLENLLLAWQEFIVGKKSKFDVQGFGHNLMDNIVELQQSLVNRTYRHGGYKSFYVTDPKLRLIHKASVRDRLLHHAVYRLLYPFFDRAFIADSYSCRLDKGTHRALNRFRVMASKVSQNQTQSCWILKCDIKKFFASIDQSVLMNILNDYISNQDVRWLLANIISSFESVSSKKVGLPLGNLTSQLFANVYMNKFDQWVKHTLKAKFYLRYADDFVFLSRDKVLLDGLMSKVQNFLLTQLKLSLHADKIFIKTIASGLDFLGWVHFSDHQVLRKATRRRMFLRLKERAGPEIFQSYLGLLKHGNTEKLKEKLYSF